MTRPAIGQPTEYRSSDFYRAAWLMSNEQALKEVRPVSEERVLFVFELNDDVKRLLAEYDAHTASVNVHAYVTAQKLLKCEMYAKVSPCRKRSE